MRHIINRLQYSAARLYEVFHSGLTLGETQCCEYIVKFYNSLIIAFLCYFL